MCARANREQRCRGDGKAKTVIANHGFLIEECGVKTTGMVVGYWNAVNVEVQSCERRRRLST